MTRKKYRVEVGPVAVRDLASYRSWIARDSPSTATKWLRTMQQRVRSLESLPQRYEIIPEAADVNLPHEYRHLAYGSYRIIYRIEGARVLVVRVIHGARILTEEMLQEES